MSINLQQIRENLQAFQQNPPEAMKRTPVKKTAQGQDIPNPNGLFTQEAIDNKRHIQAREEPRKNIYQSEEISDDRAAYQNNDNPQSLVDDFVHNNLETIEAAGLTQASLSEQPWSDDYWALYTGTLGKRYADPNFPHSDNWRTNLNYIIQNHPLDIFSSGNTSAIDKLSPAEKYDALVGDTNGSLTRRMWREGQYYYDQNGEVETWMGVCHGWAPAAYMLDRPINAISVTAANGTPITFYPSDIKALASLLWANIRTPTRFIGGRCNVENPETDLDSGRTLSQNCFDSNPGAWFLSVVNQIGVSRRSFILDATYDYQVWNQPILSYRYIYFNPQTGQDTSNLADAKIPLSAYTNDPFTQFRSSSATHVVGVAMEVEYMVETQPSHNTPDAPADDGVHTVWYEFDLELAGNGTIIGGEWLYNQHPDFLWTPTEGSQARTAYDQYATGTWQRNQPLPQIWRLAAQYASQQQKSPLGKIVERLIQLSRM
jgi:hypothetical protein